MKAYKHFISLLDDFTELNGAKLRCDFESEVAINENFVKTGNPSLTKQFNRFLSFTNDSTCVYNITCAKTPAWLGGTTALLYVDLEVGRPYRPYWEDLISLVVAGEEVELIDVNQFAQAMHHWLCQHSRAKPSALSFHVPTV